MTHLIALGWPGPVEMLIILGLGLLIFGKRLPEVGRSIGKTIVEFKKGMREVEADIQQVDEQPAAPRQALESKPQPRFDPYTGKPLSVDAREEDKTASGA